MKPQRLMVLACLGTAAVIGAVAFIGIKGQAPIIANGQSTYTATITPASLTNSIFDLREDHSRGYVDFSACTIVSDDGSSYFYLPALSSINVNLEGVTDFPVFTAFAPGGFFDGTIAGYTVTCPSVLNYGWLNSAGETTSNVDSSFSDGKAIAPLVSGGVTYNSSFSFSFNNDVVFARLAMTIACHS
jgi:hypothetical protein